MKTYAMTVLGCKVNDFESNYLKELMDQDYQEVSFKEIADIYIIFTCCVTNTAESKTRKFIHQARRRNPNAYIVAIGCLSQAKKDEATFEEVDLVVGSKHKDKIKEYIDKQVIMNDVSDLDDVTFENLKTNNYLRKTRAFLKVQDGCNQFCSYCIIPYARGRERSAKLEDVVNQAQKLSLNSREIVLTGIHTGRYFDGKNHLVDLLKALETIDTIDTIRLSSIEITEISDDLLTFLSVSKKMAHHLHIPLQAGSDHVLKLMNRPYTTKQFIDRVNEIRAKISNVAISTDLIVGFPNESDEDFKQTLDFLNAIKFSFIHLFPYSRKAGTKADAMPGHISPTIKKQREQAVMEVQSLITKEFKKDSIGLCSEVFVEKCEEGYCYGYTKEYLYTKVKGCYNIGELIKIKLVDIENDTMIGEICC